MSNGEEAPTATVALKSLSESSENIAEKVEASTGIEPVYTDLQSAA